MAVDKRVIRGDFGVIEIRQEIIRIDTLLPQLDPDWEQVDEAGHKHSGDNLYKTLREVEDETYWCSDCRDDHTDSHLECKKCKQEIHPGTRAPRPEFIQGVLTITLNGEPITEEDAKALVEKSMV